MKIRTLRLKVDEKTPKLQGTIPNIVCENEISNQCLFSKANMTTNANMEIVCLDRRLLRVCDVFKFGRNWLLLGKRISIIEIF